MLAGMPLQFLDGTDDNKMIDVIMGVDLQGFGLGSAESDDEALYSHLVKTRDVLATNPKMIVNTTNSGGLLKMIDYAIANWHTPNRDKALDILEAEEERLTKNGTILYGLTGDEIMGLQGLGLYGFFKSIKKAVKKVGSKVKTAVKKAGTAVKTAAKKVVNAILKLNPVTVAIRTGFLVALRLNMNKISSKIYPATITEAEAKKGGVDAAGYLKAKTAYNNTRKLFVDKLKGSSKIFDKAIKSGAKKKWNKAIVANEKEIETLLDRNKGAADDLAAEQASVDTQGTAGLGVVATAASAAVVASATPFIIKATNYIKNLYNKSEASSFVKAAVDKAKTVINKVKGKATEVKAKVDEVKTAANSIQQTANQAKATSAVELMRAQMQQNAQQEAQSDNNVEPTNNNEMAENAVTNPTPSFFQKHKKKILIGAAAVAAVGIGALILKNSKKKAAPTVAGLAGTGRRKTKKRATTKRKSTKRISPKRKTRTKTLKLL